MEHTISVAEGLAQLAKAVKETEIYREYQLRTEQVNQVEGLREQIDAFRKKNFEIHNTLEGEDLMREMEVFAVSMEKFREDPLVDAYLSAELAYCRMMQELQMELAEAIDFE